MMKNVYLICFLLLSLTVYAADSKIVVTVNGVALTNWDLEAAVDELIPMATFHGSVTEEKRAEFREEALENLINRELQYQDAVSRGINPDKKEFNNRIKKVRSAFASDSEYRASLERTGLTEEGVRRRIEKQIVLEAAVKKFVIEPAQMSDKALHEYYEQNIGKFKKPESVKLRIFSTKNEQKARDSLAKLKQGEDFGMLAARSSEDNYRIKGGDIGYIHRGMIYPKLESAAFSMKKGETSDLIFTEGTWFIIRVEDSQAERLLPFDEIREKLKLDLEKKKRTELMDKWISELRAKATIQRAAIDASSAVK